MTHQQVVLRAPNGSCQTMCRQSIPSRASTKCARRPLATNHDGRRTQRHSGGRPRQTSTLRCSHRVEAPFATSRSRDRACQSLWEWIGTLGTSAWTRRSQYRQAVDRQSLIKAPEGAVMVVRADVPTSLLTALAREGSVLDRATATKCEPVSCVFDVFHRSHFLLVYNVRDRCHASFACAFMLTPATQSRAHHVIELATASASLLGLRLGGSAPTSLGLRHSVLCIVISMLYRSAAISPHHAADAVVTVLRHEGPPGKPGTPHAWFATHRPMTHTTDHAAVPWLRLGRYEPHHAHAGPR